MSRHDIMKIVAGDFAAVHRKRRGNAHNFAVFDICTFDGDQHRWIHIPAIPFAGVPRKRAPVHRQRAAPVDFDKAVSLIEYRRRQMVVHIFVRPYAVPAYDRAARGKFGVQRHADRRSVGIGMYAVGRLSFSVRLPSISNSCPGSPSCLTGSGILNVSVFTR